MRFQHNKVIRVLARLLLLCSLLGLAACVTTERGGIGDKQDDVKALEYSVQLARTYIREGNWQAAKRHLKNALEIDDTSFEVYEALALVFQNTGEFELAEENYKKSIRLNGDFSRVRNNYATFLYSQKRYKEATEQLEIVVSDTLYERRAAAYVNLGRAYMQLNKLNKAEESFNRAYLMQRRNYALMYQLADVYYQLGDYPKSQQYYDAYQAQAKKQPAEALWLGIRLADKFDDRNKLSSFALALKNLYPTSKEYLLYKEAFGNE
ncbi:type IV pilus biogenesis/stability protein PilW [Oceanicoccus sp. KOV_DT_Chl]|uniref:type IV pilus biogenesis/stability protein PilW n=1 Tax=Oceanicoccus sp. KOV_DT_Chl TaxID=1904639 RepID=UPI000C7C558B|nr:type IV pilus biogenesis/stability protein PilW [Oceanicoccus sp. KOV_DT_Chl]